MVASKDVTLGEITGVHGLQGWVKVFSFSRPREQIFEYNEWYLTAGKLARKVKGLKSNLTSQQAIQPNKVTLITGRIQGKTLVAQLKGVHSHADAKALVGMTISVLHDELEVLAEDQYYWRQLIGLKVVSIEGESFGVITEMLETGANDVMLVTRQASDSQESDVKSQSWAIPWIDDVVIDVDLDAKLIKVDWDVDF